jgi:hypothetical protein
MANGATCNTSIHHCTFTLLLDMAGVTPADLASPATPDLAQSVAPKDFATPLAVDMAASTMTGGGGCLLGGATPLGSSAIPAFALALFSLGVRRRRK